MKQLRILLIEDDVDFAIGVTRSMQKLGHEVTLAFNWLSVMERLKNATFDVVVADVETPTGNALNAFEFLNESLDVQRIPKVFLTGLSDAATVQRCFQLNANYIHKSPGFIRELQSFLSDVEVTLSDELPNATKSVSVDRHAPIPSVRTSQSLYPNHPA